MISASDGDAAASPQAASPHSGLQRIGDELPAGLVVRQAGAAAVGVAAAVGAAVVAALVCAALSYWLQGVVDARLAEDAEPWRYSLLQLATALGATVQSAVVGSGSSVLIRGAEVFAVPLVVTAVLAGVLAVASRRSERALPSGSGTGLALTSAGTGAAAAGMATLIAWAAGSPMQMDATGVLSAAFPVWQPLLYGSLLLTAAAAAGRLSARLRDTPPELRPRWLTRWAWVGNYAGEAVRTVRDQVLLGAVAALVAGLAVALLWPSPGGIPQLWGFLPAFGVNLAAAGLVFAMGIRLEVRTFDRTEPSLSWTLLAGDVPLWAYLAFLVPLLATAAAGIRAGRRTGRRLPERWWLVPLTSLLTWLVLAVVVRSSYRLGLFEPAAGFSAGLDLRSLIPLSLLWGLAAVAAQLLLTPSTPAQVRRPMRSAPADDVAPSPLAAHRRMLRRGAIALAVACVIAVVVVIRPLLTGPGAADTAIRVLQAVNDGDVAYLQAHVERWPSDSPMVRADVLRATHAGERALTDITAGREVKYGDTAGVVVSYTLNGERREADFRLRWRDGRWTVGTLTDNVRAFHDSFHTFRIDGVPEPVSGAVATPPGLYTLRPDPATGIESRASTTEVRLGCKAVRASVSRCLKRCVPVFCAHSTPTRPGAARQQRPTPAGAPYATVRARTCGTASPAPHRRLPATP